MSQNTILPFRSELFESPNPIQAFKALLRQNRKDQIGLFKSGTPVLDLLVAKADFIDNLLVECWKNFLGPKECGLALIATGGYGRRELHPHSDVDILVLLDFQNPGVYQNAFEGFFTFLWDIGLKIGHAVCTVDECVKEAEQDQANVTRLMESRLISGSQDLFDEMKARTAPDRIWPSGEFFHAKMTEQQARYKKYNDTAYNLEPNVKEGPGGLRDIQLIAWVIKRHYNSPTLYELVKHGCLTKSEYAEFMKSQKFLWKVRFALHSISERVEDRLLFDHQVAVAELLGYRETKENKAVENFMQHYFRTVARIERLNEMLLQLFKEVFLKEKEDCEVIPINHQFQSLCDYLDVTHDNVFLENPLALLELFLLLQREPRLKGVRASAVRLIRQSRHLINDEFRNNREANRLFMEILKQPGGITNQLRRMNRYGLLSAYFTAFAHIVGRMQYDLFHVYTVDEHTLFLMQNVCRFALEEHNNQLPFCKSIFILIPKPELLYLGGLLHDIGKGRGGDHSMIGEKIATEFCEQHRLPATETHLVAWLVRNHLLMSMTAQRKDIQDPDVIHEFASKVGNQEYLNYLYLLTVADIRATNPKLWNSWIDSLLKELYWETHRAFRRGLDNPLERKERIKESQREARAALKTLGLPTKDVKRVWRTISEDYFQRYSADESVWHTLAIASCGPSDLPLVLLRPQSQRGTAEVFLYTKDEDFIFSQSTAILDQLGLTILDARIITSNNGYVLNSYHVLEQSGNPIHDMERKQNICNKLRKGVKNLANRSANAARRTPRVIKHFPIPTQVTYLDDPQDRYTILELFATDRPGLLSKIGQSFDQVGVRLGRAKITTIGSRVEDIFYITDKQNKPLQTNRTKEILSDAIIAIVGKN